MMKKYIEPKIRMIDLESEGTIATSGGEEKVDIYSETEGKEGVVLTEKKNFWDRDGIWK